MWPFFLIGSWSLQSGPGSNLLDSTLVVLFMSYMTVVGLMRGCYPGVMLLGGEYHRCVYDCVGEGVSVSGVYVVLRVALFPS